MVDLWDLDTSYLDDFNKYRDDVTKYISDYQYQVQKTYYHMDEYLQHHDLEFKKHYFSCNYKLIYCYHETEDELKELLNKNIRVASTTLYKLKDVARDKRTETIYDLTKFFDRENYENGDKFRRKINKPLNRLVNSDDLILEELKEEDLDEVNKLYDEWVEMKLSDPTVMKIMFPTARYKKCYMEGFNDTSIKTLVLKYKGKIIAFETFALNGDSSYGLACIVSRNGEIPNISEILKVNAYKYLQTKYNIRYVSVGITNGCKAGLVDAKHQWPHFTIDYYIYKKTM